MVPIIPSVLFWLNFCAGVINVFIFRYCPSCKNDSNEVVKAGEKLKQSKKKAKMPSACTDSQRDWGKVTARNQMYTVYICVLSSVHTKMLYTQ